MNEGNKEATQRSPLNHEQYSILEGFLQYLN